MKKTGAILKKAREEKGLSLHEIGLSLKINSKILRAIEDGDEENLPAKTFLRGFVQSYSNYLHIDTQMVLQSFYEEMGSTTPRPFIREAEKKDEARELEMNTTAQGESSTNIIAPVSTPKAEELPTAKEEKQEAEVIPMRQEALAKEKTEPLPSISDSRFKKSIGWLAIAIILVVSIGFTKKMIDKYSKEAEVPSAEVAQTMEGATPVISEASEVDDILDETISEATDSKATQAQNSIELHAAPSSSTADAKIQMPQALTQTSTETIKETSAIKKEEPKKEETKVAEEKVEKKEIAKEEVKAPLVEKKEEAVQKPVELIVEALDAVEIEYASASGKPQKIKLSSEQVHTFKSKSGLKISFSNGGAVNLILNGKDIGIPGDLGKPIKLAY